MDQGNAEVLPDTEELTDIVAPAAESVKPPQPTEYLKPHNPLEMREAIEKNCYRDGAFDRREAQGMIVYNWGASFLFSPGPVQAWAQAVGNLRLPDPLFNEGEAKWHYNRGRKVYEVAIAARAGENSRGRQLLEAELFLFDTLCSRPSEIIEQGYPVTPPHSVLGYRI